MPIGSEPLKDLDEISRIEYLLSLREQGVSVEAICLKYGVARSTFYYWLKRYEHHQTFKSLSKAPHTTHSKVTEEVKAAVLAMHKANPKLGCWRLSLFEYENISLGPTTIWEILTEAKSPKLPPQILYSLTHPYQVWFIDHMHLKTLKNGQKVYSLIVLDGWSRVLLSDEVVLSKSAIDACVILLRAFARWGLPQAILSDNAKAFTSFLYTMLLGALRVKICYITPGHPWENPFAESLIGTLRAYFYPHVQRKKTVEGISHVYVEKTDYYNNRPHWEFRKDEVKTPLGKLGTTKGRPLPEDFELSLLAKGKQHQRTVDGQGRISWKRYRLYVRLELKRQKVEIREFFDSLVVTYRSGSVVSYECVHQHNEIQSIKNTPTFHEHQDIFDSPQLELFDLSDYELRYVSRRQSNRRRNILPDASQLLIQEVNNLEQK